MAGDGFSDPNPAPAPGGDEPGMIPEEGTILDIVDDSVSCTNCVHYQTCAVIAGIRPMLEEWTAGDREDEAPIDPTDLALVCEQFEIDPELVG